MPRSGGPERGVLSYQCAIDAVASTAFPSYLLRRHAKVWGGFPPWEYLLVAAALDRGWVVVVPDHEGPRGVWGAPCEPGYCVLDGLRAAISHPPAGLSADSPMALWGYSGGGLATGWAAEMWAEYAPELNVVGAVLGSPVGDLGATFRRLNGSLFAGLAALVISALRQEFPRFAALVQSHTNTKGLALLSELEQLSTIRAIARFPLRKVERYLDLPLDELLRHPEIVDMFDQVRLGHSVPAMPLLMIQAVADPIISTRAIDALAAFYRSGGADVVYVRDILSEHLILHPVSAPLALRWLHGRFAGEPVEPTSTRRTLLLLHPASAWGLLRLAYVTVKVATGRTF
ncbi:lipase family protein [Mycobacteroides abscessus]|uniref:lipase family protein n=1 Tax=Mycobacteroides abscessus TaxID=36809 RepID=UPI0013F4F23B|nr:lipase family protein [Mycobacteroides abscessus]